MDEVLRFLGVRIWIADILYSWDLFEVLCTPNRRPSSSKERTAIPQDPFKVRLAAFVRKVVAEVDDAKKANNTVQGLFRTNPVNWGLNSNSQSAQPKLNIIGKSWHGMAWVDLTGLTQKIRFQVTRSHRNASSTQKLPGYQKYRRRRSCQHPQGHHRWDDTSILPNIKKKLRITQGRSQVRQCC